MDRVKIDSIYNRYEDYNLQVRVNPFRYRPEVPRGLQIVKIT